MLNYLLQQWFRLLTAALAPVFNQLKQLGEQMSALDDELAAIKAAQDATNASLAAIQTDTAALKADVEKLLAEVAAMPTAGLTADQQTALDGIKTAATGIQS